MVRRPSRRSGFRGIGNSIVRGESSLSLLTGGTFTRSSEASYLTGAPTDGSSAFLTWALANARRIEDQGDGLGPMLKMEGARTNLVVRSRDTLDASWTAGSADTPTYDVGGGPDALILADRDITVAANFGRYRQVPVVTAPALHATSVYLRRPPGSGAGTAQVNPYDSQHRTGVFAITELWSRVDLVTAPTNNPITYIPWESRAGGIATNIAMDYLCDLHQIEVGAFPSSAIRTINDPVIRAADVLTYAVGEYPASFLTRGFRFTYAPDASSAEINTENVAQDLFRFGASGNRVTFDVGGASNVRIAVEGAGPGFPSITTGDLVFSRGQLLTIEIRPSSGEIVVSGATSGNGTTSGSAYPFASDTLNVGNTAGVKPAFGRFGTVIEAL